MGIFVGYSQKRRSVRIASPGKDQMVLCNVATIFLHATLTDESNTRNHTFFWEQMSGPEVILDNTDQLETSYSFVETTNRRFRFYLDYGTNKEQYKDVEIFHTPTSLTQGIHADGIPNSISQTVKDYALSPDFLVPYNDYPNAPVIVTPATRIDYVEVLPDLLPKGTGMYIYTSPNYVQEPQDLYKSYTFGDYPLTALLPKGVYKFKFHYLINGQERVYSSPLIVSTPPASVDSSGTYVNDLIWANSAAGKKLEGSFLRFFYTVKNVVGSPLVASAGKGNFVSIARFTYFQKHLQDDVLIASAGNGNFYSITRFDSSNIGH